MPNYQNAKIYTIRSHKTDDIYIGSTIQMLSNRMGAHRSKFKAFKKGKTNYTSSFKILEHGDAYIELLEMFPCNNFYELTRREGELIRVTENCINKNIAGRTVKEWHQDNSEKQITRTRKWRKDNPDKYYLQEGKKVLCKCGSTVRKGYLSRHKKNKKHIEFEFMNLSQEEVKKLFNIN